MSDDDADSLRAPSTFLQAIASALLARDMTGIAAAAAADPPPPFPPARKRRTRKRTSLPSWEECALESAWRESRSKATDPFDAESHLEAIACHVERWRVGDRGFLRVMATSFMAYKLH